MTIDNKNHVVAPAVSTDDYQFFRMMLIADSVKKNSKHWSWLLKKYEKQPEPQCLVCTMNLAILILEE